MFLCPRVYREFSFFPFLFKIPVMVTFSRTIQIFSVLAYFCVEMNNNQNNARKMCEFFVKVHVWLSLATLLLKSYCLVGSVH